MSFGDTYRGEGGGSDSQMAEELLDFITSYTGDPHGCIEGIEKRLRKAVPRDYKTPNQKAALERAARRFPVPAKREESPQSDGG